MNNNLLKTLPASFTLLSLVIMLVACGGSDPEPPPSEAEKVTAMLISGDGKWTPPTTGGVTVDGTDVTNDLFAGFSITFQDGTYTTTGTSPVWPAQDTWRFKDETAKVIIRGVDEKEMTITELSNSQVKLTLYWPATTTSNGRQHSLKGLHVFTLNN